MAKITLKRLEKRLGSDRFMLESVLDREKEQLNKRLIEGIIDSYEQE